MFLDPTNDVAFRRIFGNEEKKGILISFLNSILELTDKKLIKDVEILNPFQVPKIRELKETILDVKCTDNRGVTYIVEMQVCKPSAFDKRVLYYTSKAYANQIEIGEDYPRLNQVVFLGILGFTMFDTGRVVTNHLILEKSSGEHHFKDFSFNFVELPKFNKTEDELESVEDKWIYFLKNAKGLKIMPHNVVEEEIKDAYGILDKFNWTKDELDLYDTISMYRQDERGRLEQAEIKGLKKGIEKGLKEGEEIGIKKGEEIGIKKGKLDTARKMLDKGMDASLIAEITGLDTAEIEEMS